MWQRGRPGTHPDPRLSSGAVGTFSDLRVRGAGQASGSLRLVSQRPDGLRAWLLGRQCGPLRGPAAAGSAGLTRAWSASGGQSALPCLNARLSAAGETASTAEAALRCRSAAGVRSPCWGRVFRAVSQSTPGPPFGAVGAVHAV